MEKRTETTEKALREEWIQNLWRGEAARRAGDIAELEHRIEGILEYLDEQYATVESHADDLTEAEHEAAYMAEALSEIREELRELRERLKKMEERWPKYSGWKDAALSVSHDVTSKLGTRLKDLEDVGDGRDQWLRSLDRELQELKEWRESVNQRLHRLAGRVQELEGLRAQEAAQLNVWRKMVNDRLFRGQEPELEARGGPDAS